jgi:hypothetical protein
VAEMAAVEVVVVVVAAAVGAGTRVRTH